MNPSPAAVFPSAFESAWHASRALYYLASWAGGLRCPVWVPQFASLRNHVREISRTAAGGRVAGLVRSLGLWPEVHDVAASASPAEASSLFSACLSEAEALLELGYPEQEGLTFVTRAPQPSDNTRRTPQEMRAALHHLGGDFGLFRELLRFPDPHSPALRVTFSVWPTHLVDGERTVQIALPFEGQAIPASMHFSRELRGYMLLVVHDLAARLRSAENIPLTSDSFAGWIEGWNGGGCRD